jgi:CheY-like chemotaxis protein
MPPSPEEFKVPTAIPVDDESWRGTGTILVVEDEETVRSTVGKILDALGFDVVLASNGREGVDRFTSVAKPYELILLDLTMPQLDGVQVFDEVRRVNPTVPIVLMSGYARLDVLARFSDRKLAAFIQKPFDIPTLQRTLRAVLASGEIPVGE